MSTLNFQYQAFGFNLASDILLPELSEKLLIANEQSSISVVSGNYGNWPSIEASPHSTQCLQLAANEWRLALDSIGWFRAAAGESLEYQRWDDSVSNRDLRRCHLLLQRQKVLMQVPGRQFQQKRVIGVWRNVSWGRMQRPR